jgi:hypothetical protein
MEPAAGMFGAIGESVVFLDHFKDLPDPRQRGKSLIRSTRCCCCVCSRLWAGRRPSWISRGSARRRSRCGGASCPNAGGSRCGRRDGTPRWSPQWPAPRRPGGSCATAPNRSARQLRRVRRGGTGWRNCPSPGIDSANKLSYPRFSLGGMRLVAQPPIGSPMHSARLLRKRLQRIVAPAEPHLDHLRSAHCAS